MAELPELEILRKQMGDVLTGRTVSSAEATQPKCLNIAPSAFCELVIGRRVGAVERRGKWLVVELQPDHSLLMCPGMGFDLWYYAPGAAIPPKYQLRLEMDDGSGFTCRFWWFGYLRLYQSSDVDGCDEIAKLGPNPMAINAGEFEEIVMRHPRSTVKSLMLDQGKLSGIGNAYSHDILWTAGLHPSRKLGTLSAQEIVGYLAAMKDVLSRAIRLGGIEDDFFREGGNHSDWEGFSLIGYKEGKPCPRCGLAIEKIKTGATASFVCPGCQPSQR